MTFGYISFASRLLPDLSHDCLPVIHSFLPSELISEFSEPFQHFIPLSISPEPQVGHSSQPEPFKMYTSTLLLAILATLAAAAPAAQNAGAGAAAAAGAADFGKCTPTMDFQLGRPGRKATEGTFLPTDPLVAKGQQDALNPAIITNRICDQLTNVCDANDAAKALCATAQDAVSKAGTRDATTADVFNKALGF
jgi:hypothetical protein